MNAAEVVTVQHLIKRYGNVLAVNDLSVSIHDGEIFDIIGPNGAGKTTSVECISGLHAPDAGAISVYGLSPQKDKGQSFLQPFPCKVLWRKALLRTEREELKHLLRRRLR